MLAPRTRRAGCNGHDETTRQHGHASRPADVIHDGNSHSSAPDELETEIMSAFAELDLDELLSSPTESEATVDVREMIEGCITRIDDQQVFVDIGFVNDGVISLDEWDEAERPPEVGQTVNILVEQSDEDMMSAMHDPSATLRLTTRMAQPMLRTLDTKSLVKPDALNPDTRPIDQNVTSSEEFGIADWIKTAVDEFEEDLDAQRSPSIGRLLDQCPADHKAELFRDLLPYELSHRVKQGVSISVTEYYERFPDLTAEVDEVFANEIETPTPELGVKRRLGQYELGKRLGVGGFGTVYLARHIDFDRHDAIKILHDATEEHIRRFKREANIITGLHHPHIVLIHYLDTEDGLHFIVMEYAPGGSLAERVSRGPVPVSTAVKYTIQVADAVDAAHARDVIHRDIKPANILIDAKGDAKVTDFGLAKRLDRDSGNTREGVLVGTFAYMAPEQIQGWPADKLSDIYSIGATLYSMLTGILPVPGFVSARLLNREVDGELERICSRCMNIDPKQRYNAAKELSEDLQSYRRVLAEGPAPPR